MDRVYLDNNATTQPTPEVAAAVAEAHEALWANPSSVHRFGQAVRQRIELARASVAKLIGAKPREIVFTSGGTEANHMAVWGTLGGAVAKEGASRVNAGRDFGGDSEAHTEATSGGNSGGNSGGGGGATLMTTGAEHAAVRELGEVFEKRGGRVVWLALRPGGAVEVEALRTALAEASGVVLVSVMWANNETGVIQPIEEVASVVAEAREAARAAGRPTKIVFHVDATQAVGKLPVDVSAVGLDLMTFAAHKFHGPKGAGALYIRRGVRLSPQQHGGPQEMQRRGGTENVAGILGMGVAAEQAAAFVCDAARIETLRGLRDRLEAQVQAGLAAAGLFTGPAPTAGSEARGDAEATSAAGVSEKPSGGAVVNSGGVDRLWNTTNLGFTGLEAEAILLGLSERGVCASAGAACSSGSLEPSPVLRAMGVPEATAHGSIRLSLSRHSTVEEIDHAAAVLVAVVGRLMKVMPMG